ncbi:MAG: hypothetical protein AAB685_02110 [Patescibacteria group bacterium]
MSKRTKFVVSSIILSAGFVGIQFLDNIQRFWAIGALSLTSVLLFIWTLAEGLAFDGTLLTLILPPMYTLGVGLFWFLLPASIFARIPIVIMYGIGLYALSLTGNILSVAAIRTIALSRAAKGVGFVMTLLTAFLLYDSILSLKADLWINIILSMITSFPLFLQGLWQSELESKVSKNSIILSFIFTLGTAEIAALLYFWPVSVVVGSLFLTVGVYTLLGLGQAKLEGRIFSQTIREYLTVAILVFIGMFIATSWRG